MNNIGKLIKAKTISFNEMVVRYYHNLELNEQEAMVIMLLYIQNEEGNQILSTSLLQSKVSMSSEDLSNIILKLIQKGYIELLINDDGKETFSLDKIIDALGTIIDKCENNTNNQLDRSIILQELNEYCEKCYQRLLTAADLVVLNHWLDLNYTLEEMKQAILDSLKAKKTHLKYADAILANRNLNKNRIVEEDIDEEIKAMLEGVYVKRK